MTTLGCSSFRLVHFVSGGGETRFAVEAKLRGLRYGREQSARELLSELDELNASVPSFDELLAAVRAHRAGRRPHIPACDFAVEAARGAGEELAKSSQELVEPEQLQALAEAGEEDPASPGGFLVASPSAPGSARQPYRHLRRASRCDASPALSRSSRDEHPSPAADELPAKLAEETLEGTRTRRRQAEVVSEASGTGKRQRRDEASCPDDSDQSVEQEVSQKVEAAERTVEAEEERDERSENLTDGEEVEEQPEIKEEDEGMSSAESMVPDDTKSLPNAASEVVTTKLRFRLRQKSRPDLLNVRAGGAVHPSAIPASQPASVCRSGSSATIPGVFTAVAARKGRRLCQIKAMPTPSRALVAMRERRPQKLVLFTGFSRSERARLRRVSRRLGAVVLASLPRPGDAVAPPLSQVASGSGDPPQAISASAVRIVVRCQGAAGPQEQVGTERRQEAARRTLSYLDGLLAGCWVVSQDWVHESRAAGHWLAEELFEVKGDRIAAGGAAKIRAALAEGGQQLFSGIRLSVPGSSAGSSCDAAQMTRLPPPAVLACLARRGGAEILSSQPTCSQLGDMLEEQKTEDALVAAHTTLPERSWCQGPLMIAPIADADRLDSTRRPRVTAKWLLDCISRGEVVPPSQVEQAPFHSRKEKPSKEKPSSEEKEEPRQEVNDCSEVKVDAKEEEEEEQEEQEEEEGMQAFRGGDHPEQWQEVNVNDVSPAQLGGASNAIGAW